VKYSLLLLALVCGIHSAEVKMYGMDDSGNIIETSLVIINDSEILSIKAESFSEMNVVSVKFNDSGAKKNLSFTSLFKGKQISIWIDGQFLSSPKVIEPSVQSVVISSKLSIRELKQFDK